MDMKCLASSRCWYCKDLCESCLLCSGFGSKLISQTKSGVTLKFCSQSCAQYFTGSEEKPISLNIEILPSTGQQSSLNVLLHINGSGMYFVDEGIKIACLICHGYHSENYPDGRFFILCQLRSLFSQKFIDMFVSEGAVLEEPLPHADCPSARENAASLKASGHISRIITSALKKCQEFFHSVCTEEVELNLNILTKFRSHLFVDDKATETIKVII